MKKLTKKQIDMVNQMLIEANGRRRERLLTLPEILTAIEASRKLGLKSTSMKYLGGGAVCNNYGYRAYQTVCLVITIEKETWIVIQKNSACKGSTGFGRINNASLDATNLMKKVVEFDMKKI